MPLADVYTAFVRIEGRDSIKKWLRRLRPPFEPSLYLSPASIRTNTVVHLQVRIYVQCLSPALRALCCSTHTTLSHQKACILNVELSEQCLNNVYG